MAAKRLTHEQIRSFRSAVAKLKRAGLLQPNIDARKARPESRTLQSAVKRFRSVVQGNAATIKLSRLNLSQREAIARNIQIARPAGLPSRVIIPHFKDETVRVKSKSIEFQSLEGVRRLELPKARTDTIGHFFGDLKKSKVQLPDRVKGQLFGARFFNGRTQLFESVRDLLNTIHVYNTVVSAHGRKQTAEIIRNIEIITVPDTAADRRAWRNAKRSDKHAQKTPRRKTRNP